METFINALRKHSSEIKSWASGLQIEDTDMFQPYDDPQSAVKVIKTPITLIDDPNLPSFFLEDRIRTVLSMVLYPGCNVIRHNHMDMSFIVYNPYSPTNYDNIPFDETDQPYQTTHLVLETNPDAWFMFGDKKYTWQHDKYDILDVLNMDHEACNGGKTNVRFLYFDFYW